MICYDDYESEQNNKYYKMNNVEEQYMLLT